MGVGACGGGGGEHCGGQSNSHYNDESVVLVGHWVSGFLSNLNTYIFFCFGPD